MKTLIKKKLYMGRVELRDYEVNEAIEHEESVKVILDNPSLPEHKQYMILTPEQLAKGQYINTQISKYNKGQTYLLRGYKWKGQKQTYSDPVTGKVMEY